MLPWVLLTVDLCVDSELSICWEFPLPRNLFIAKLTLFSIETCITSFPKNEIQDMNKNA